VSSTCFEHPSVHPQEDLYMPFYGISFMHPYKQCGRWQNVLASTVFTLVFQCNDSVFDMFRTSTCSSSGRLVHAV